MSESLPDRLTLNVWSADDREPQPTDGPDYHADHAAWEAGRTPPPSSADHFAPDDEGNTDYGGWFPSADEDDIDGAAEAAREAWGGRAWTTKWPWEGLSESGKDEWRNVVRAVREHDAARRPDRKAEEGVERLAEFIMHEVDGEPSRGDEGAVECAIRLIREARRHR